MAGFQLAAGVRVPDMDGIHECYEVEELARPSNGQPYHSFTVNISIEKLRPLLEGFINGLDEPCFMVCDVPASQQEEAQLRRSDSDPFHRNVHYLDGRSRGELTELLEAYGDWLVHDGMCQFGFASHRSGDEVFVGKYKLTSLFVSEPEGCTALLSRLGIPREDKIRTVWDNFTADSPGECQMLRLDGRTVIDVIEGLKARGLYLAGQREG